MIYMICFYILNSSCLSLRILWPLWAQARGRTDRAALAKHLCELRQLQRLRLLFVSLQALLCKQRLLATLLQLREVRFMSLSRDPIWYIYILSVNKNPVRVFSGFLFLPRRPKENVDKTSLET